LEFGMNGKGTHQGKKTGKKKKKKNTKKKIANFSKQPIVGPKGG